MYKVDRPSNSLHTLEEASFSSLGFTERKHLQEWIVKNPQTLSHDSEDELLIIQKEFSGFDNTNERLDLLALDKQGNLVLIENKLDDSGRDVVWQAIKYAGYCANLRKEQIVDIFQRYLNSCIPEEKNSAEDLIVEFLACANLDCVEINNSLTQRVIFVAANFRKEVTNTVLWLMQYGLKIQCFKAKPYKFGEEVFIDIKQVIPMPEAESFMIGMALKEAEEQSTKKEVKKQAIVYEAFWTNLLNSINSTGCSLFKNISPSSKYYLNAASGVRGTSYALVFIKASIRIEFYISGKDAHINTKIFNWLLERKEVIESTFGQNLDWQPLENKDACRIAFAKTGIANDESNWPEIIEWVKIHLILLENSLAPFIQPLKLAVNEFNRSIVSIESEE